MPGAGKSNEQLKGYLLVLIATIIWSGNFIVARALMDSIPPVTLAFLRWGTAVLFLFPFGIKSVVRSRGLIRENIGHLALTGFLGVTVFNTIIYYAAHTSNAMNLSLIAIFSPVFMVIFARIFLHDTITVTSLLGVLIAISGTILLVSGGTVETLLALTFSRGDLMMLADAAIFALYGILVRTKAPKLGPIAFLLTTFVLGLLFLVPWLIWEWFHGAKMVLNGTAVLSVLYLGIGPSLIAFFCWNQAVAAIGPVKAGFVYYCLPLFSGIEAALLLNESITVIHLVSGILILVGVVIATRR